MTDAELLGRFAALELVAAAGLYANGHHRAASGSPGYLNGKLTTIKAGLNMTNDQMRGAAEAALDRMFHGATTGDGLS